MVLSKALYGAAIWAPCYTSDLERIHTRYFKRALFLPLNTLNSAVRRESDNLGIEYFVFKEVLLWLGKIDKMPNDILPKLCWLKLLNIAERNRNLKLNWCNQVSKLFENIGVNLLANDLTLNDVVSNSDLYLLNYKYFIFERDSKQISETNSLQIYKFISDNSDNKYFYLDLSLFFKKLYAQFRLANNYYCKIFISNNSLTLNSNAHCGACNDIYSSDNIMHFLKDCPLFHDLRTDFLNNVNESESTDSWLRILSSNNITTIKKFCNFVLKALARRLA